MKLQNISAALLLLIILSSCGERAPVTFKSESGWFEIQCPIKFDEHITQKITKSPSLQSIDGRDYIASDTDRRYLVSYFDMSSYQRGSIKLDEFLDKGSTDYAQGGKLLTKTNITLGRHPGRELTIETRFNDQPALAKARIYVIRGRVYSIEIVAKSGTMKIEEMDAFLRSFKCRME